MDVIKTLFIRDYKGRIPIHGEVEIGWNFTGEKSFDLPFGLCGIGKGEQDQNERLANIIAELREQQAKLGNVSDFEIDDRRAKPNFNSK